MSSAAREPQLLAFIVSLGEPAMHLLTRALTTTLFYGIFILLFSHTATVYFTRKQSSQSQHWMFVITVITFLLATVHEVANLLEAGTYIRSVFMVAAPIEKQELAAQLGKVNKTMEKYGIICLWLNAFGTFISDCVIVWRASVLLRHRRWLAILPLFLVLCSVVLSLPYLIDIHSDNRKLGFLFILSNGLSLGTNVVATALIGHIYWIHRKDMTSGLGVHRATQAERLLALLIESGVIFCLLQGTMFVLEFRPPPRLGSSVFYPNAIFGAAYYAVAAMYPTIVIALVNHRSTLDQIYFVNTFPPTSNNGMGLKSETTLQDMAFAPSPLQTPRMGSCHSEQYE